MTDLFIASENGLAFYNCTQIDAMPQVLLQGVSFQLVTSSEVLGPNRTSNLVIFAVSTHGELYYLEGTRHTKSPKGPVTFSQSGFPIRQDVLSFSTQYNPSNAAELIYFGNTDNKTVHLWKDKADGLWHEQQISVQLPDTEPMQ